MLLKNASLLLGEDLTYVGNTNVKISHGRFRRIRPRLRPSAKEESVDCEGLLVIPGLVNAHTHVGDSIAKDVALYGTVDQKIHPVLGAKRKILRNTNPDHLASFMSNSCRSMIHKGITTFVDFREGGTAGIMLLKRALSDLPIRSIILGRAEFYQDGPQIARNEGFPKKIVSELETTIKKCDGLGVSGANENSDSVLRFYSRFKKLRAVHCSETKESVQASKRGTGASETVRALRLKPHFLVHMTHASEGDLRMASKKVDGIVICPRANAALQEGIPDAGLMLKAGCNLALGTDNVMINSPDLFREMDYLWKVSMAVRRKRISPRSILKMATVNAGRMLRKDIGVIENGRLADCVFIEKHAIDLEPLHNPHAAVVHRASESSIRAVMIGGELVHGRI